MEVRSDTESVPRNHPTRRDVLDAAGAVTFGGALSALPTDEPTAARVDPESPGDSEVFDGEPEAATGVFPQSVASGGPTPSGVLLWTRLAPDAHDGDTPLGVEVAEDGSFDRTVYRGTVPAGAFGPDRDFTAIVDVDGQLGADRRYFYRFVYGGDASPVGRCRTLPRPDDSPDSLRLAVASCNDYLAGYFGGFGRIAEEDADFLVHLGDFIYEDAGDGIGDRRIDLPSGRQQAEELADYRHLYRTYRSDDLLQSALERHTLLHTWDDHEIVDNRWWNYETDAPETYSHPRGDDPEFMRQLYVAAIRAYTEYVPARVRYDPTGESGLAPDAIRENFRLYRSVSFGDLADLFLTDERLYRSPPPDHAEDDTTASVSEVADSPGRTMLGRDQRRWLLNGMTDSDAAWKLWGNEVLAAGFRFTTDGRTKVNADAWDGYWPERERVLSELSDAGVENVVALTGDMHSYLAARLRPTYGTFSEDSATESDDGTDDRSEPVGVEFMAPALSSDNLVAAGQLPEDNPEAVVAALRARNPHVEWFDSSHWGYAVVEMTRDQLVYSAYAVDRTVDSADAPKRLLRRYRVPAGEATLERADGERGDRT